MASYLAADQPYLASQPDAIPQDQQDPFSSSTSSHHGRFSHFDNQLFALGPTASPDQAKRALEAHLAETERRIQEASKLGTTLVQQRKDLADRLKDVERQQSEGDITPELRQKLVEVEKEYNEVGRESARAFLPKSRVSSAEMAGGSPFAGDKRSASPSKFESQAINSPSKLSVPNRKQRNQPSNRVHDIEFATEISTSLLSQVRHLQALLSEREESLKTVTLEKSRLEIEAEGFNQRLRSLDESEHRYKDENWNLETQIHELLAAAKEAADREKKLNHNLGLLQAEKSAAQKELDDIKLSHAKLAEFHASAIKHHEAELGSVKRSMTMADNERGALQRKVEDLTGQNQELARAIAHQRGRLDDREQNRGLTDDDIDTAPDNVTPEHSPPPSPIKGTPRHSMLESETLKSSLHHAHRMIQNLKGNIHREKTEKLELKRMLQDARDELDARRVDFASGNGKRNRKVESREFKKPKLPGQLGGLRGSKSEIFIDDPSWEEDDGQNSPSQAAAVAAARAAADADGAARSVNNYSDVFDTANEQDSTDAFETANERGTETEDFQTGAEEMSSSDELTETEGPSGPVRSRAAPMALTKPGDRNSFQSTASASGDEYSYEDARTPEAQQPQRLRLRLSRGLNRRSRAVSEDPSFQQSSPASFVSSSRDGTPQAAGQSLFAELGDMSDEEDSILGTPSRSRVASQSMTPTSRPSTARRALDDVPILLPSIPPVPRLPMIDAGVMTDPWELRPATPSLTATPLITGGLTGAALTEAAHMATRNAPTGLDAAPVMSDNHTMTEPEPRNSTSDGHTSTDPQPARIMNDSYTLTDPEPVRLVCDNHTSTEPEPRNSTSDGHTSTDPQPARVMNDGYTLTDPEPVRVVCDSHTSTEPESVPIMSDRSTAMDTPVKANMSNAASQWHKEQLKEQLDHHLLFVGEDRTRPISVSTYSDRSSQYDSEVMQEKMDKFPSPPASRAHTPLASLNGREATANTLTMSSIRSEFVEPESPILSDTSSEVRRSTPEAAPNPAPWALSAIQFVETEPISPPRSPRRDAVFIPRDYDIQTIEEGPETPNKGTVLGGVFGVNKNKAPATPIIAEDDTCQSPSDSPMMETPESQRPFKEISGNPHTRPMKKVHVETIDESSQTALTATQIDELQRLKSGAASPSRGAANPLALRVKSQDSIGSGGRARSKMPESDIFLDPFPAKRPSSAGSGRNNSFTSIHPPLPTDHKQVIAAAARRSGSLSGGVCSMSPPSLPTSAPRSGNSMGPPSLPNSTQRSSSSSGGVGSMGPPPVPISGYKNPLFRPRTPTSQPPQSPTSMKAGTTPRLIHSSAGTAEIQSPTRTARTAKSRASSVSSFASELDTRFNMSSGLPQGVEPGTDPRMINAITQTMIGEYLWKYTRKTGRGSMSENRHRRYFWVHPYTRTLYWSDRDPSAAGRAELKAKSVPIEAVRVVTDDNPMPPGLHRKSLIIMTPGRAVKFTATTGQRHETWFNALSYLLLRTGEEAVGDTASMANGALTQEDVDEFNPGYRSQSTRRDPASLSSSKSRTTRNETPANTQIAAQPYLTASTSSRATMGTFSRLSSYWKPSEAAKNASFSSRKSRQSLSENGVIYDASEVHDSAEDLREQYERQDRESDRLENVRACCDGRHDVGHLHNHSVKGRHASATIGAASGSSSRQGPTPRNSTKSRHSTLRRTD